MSRLLLAVSFLVCVVGLSVSAFPPNPAPTVEASVLRVIDGDTIEVRITEAPPGSPVAIGETVKVRYIGIDTPETVHPNKPVEKFGKEASEFNHSIVDEHSVYLELDIGPWDRYDRLLAYVYLDSQGFAMVNAMLVALGFANASPYPPNVRYESQFRELEATARTLELGLWYTPKVEEEFPNDTSTEKTPCNCSGPDLNCGDFATHAEAQACYEYCLSQGRGDVFKLDRDEDGQACESLP